MDTIALFRSFFLFHRQDNAEDEKQSCVTQLNPFASPA